MRSYLCEHTAEFALVPRLKSILGSRFGVVTPVYFWKSREGNSLSWQIHKARVLRVLAMFPRRPKFMAAEDKMIWIKVNRALLEFSRASLRMGMPAIAGVPLARSFSELSEDREPMWIKLSNGNPEDIIFEVDIFGRKIQSTHPEGHSLEVIAEQDIPNLLEDEASPMSWSEAIDVISELRAERYRDDFFSRFFFIGGYKPVYFLVFERL
jgi:hypothetical protein